MYQMYGEQKLEIPPKIAGLLCAAIISDTLMFRSPTCTLQDKMAAGALEMCIRDRFLWIVCEVKMFRIIQCRFYICNLVKQSCTNFFNSPLYRTCLLYTSKLSEDC